MQLEREPSMKFTPASQGDSYDKMSPCNHCNKSPGKKPFPVCAGCKEASFCSTECQKKAWPLHKTFCGWRKRRMDEMANVPSSTDFPSFQIRKRLMADFIEVHECTFPSGFTSAIIAEGGIENFPYDKRCLLVTLRYRPDCQENPSVAFNVIGSRWATEVELKLQYNRAWGKSPMDIHVDTRMRQGDAGYIAMFCVYFIMEDDMIGELYPQTRTQFQAPGVLGVLQRQQMAALDHSKWLSRVQGFVRDGLVVHSPRQQALIMQLGKMEMEKGKWVWVQLTKAELLKHGYTSDFPGFMF
ncbi:hypothetical protein FB45DRAFT_933833 [Roridomyces roridus]|uniref:MYND-type domain-containing protein n=1 Tax=Roridomyces roridus TaxID=1738132 RepID=A0AAD7FDG3_9AGAR|nr:hypothetical protein FB45DRAFT_933833 [Roridomyces roridus]